MASRRCHLFLGVCVPAKRSPWRQRPQEATETGGRGKKSGAGEIRCRVDILSYQAELATQPWQTRSPGRCLTCHVKVREGTVGKVTELESFRSDSSLSIPCVLRIPSSAASLLVSVCHCVTLTSQISRTQSQGSVSISAQEGLVPRWPQPILGLRGKG